MTDHFHPPEALCFSWYHLLPPTRSIVLLVVPHTFHPFDLFFASDTAT